MRHSFATVAAGMGYSELTIAGLPPPLEHHSALRAVPDAALVAAADRVAVRVEAALDGHPSADVVKGSKDGVQQADAPPPEHPIRILKFAQICAI